MSTTTANPPHSAIDSAPAAAASAGTPYLFGPVVDFICLGGATLLLLALVSAIPDRLLEYSKLLAWSTLVAHVINNPHFAHSYHLFYRGFTRKGFSDEYPADWRRRYLFAGVTVPLLLLVFFAWCLTKGDVQLIGYSVNLMFFSVGWHYVKQGYGMLMLDSVLKRRFFTEAEKRILLFHAYTIWLLSWMVANEVAEKYDFWGIAYFTFGVPRAAMYCAYALAAFTGARVLIIFAARLRADKPLPPLNGLVAFVVSMYIWLLYRNPIAALAFPAMHSLQYLVVVWRYELNFQKAKSSDGGECALNQTNRNGREPSPSPYPLPHMRGGEGIKAMSRRPAALVLRMGAFYGLAVGLGYFGFWYLPGVLKNRMPEISAAFGGWAFFLVTWVFINVHHYFMDSVIWRKGNPETGKYLFR